MGGGGSTIQKMPDIIIQEPYPPEKGIEGLAFSAAKDCSKCVLSVEEGISTSTVRLQREYGTTTYMECGKFYEDIGKVERREMAFAELKRNLQQGKYLRPV